VLAEEQNDWWDNVDKCDFEVLDESAKVFEVELGHDDELVT